MKYTKPNYRASALVTIDIQCDTLDGQPFEIPGTSAALPNVKMVLDIYRQKRMPVIHIVRIYKKDGSSADLYRKEAVERGEEILLEDSSGCELAPAMFENIG